MLDTAGTSAVAASTGSKKATLQKLMYFSMIEPGYPMDKEMMLEPGSTVLKDMSFCNVAFFAQLRLLILVRQYSKVS